MRYNRSTLIGTPLFLKNQKLNFSTYPLKNSRPITVSNNIYIKNPWPLLRDCAIKYTRTKTQKEAAVAAVEQSRQFMTAAQSVKLSSAYPVLLYYSLFNLVKCHAYISNALSPLQRLNHGLSAVNGYSTDLDSTHEIEVFNDDPKSSRNAFALYASLCDAKKSARKITLRSFSRSILIGHRTYCEAANISEKFIAARDPQFHQSLNRKGKQNGPMVTFIVSPDDMSRCNISEKSLLRVCGMDSKWKVITKELYFSQHALVIGVHLRTVPSRNALDMPTKIRELSKITSSKLWTVANTDAPNFRRYYFHANAIDTLPQRVAEFAFLFYLGSMARYHPQKYNDLTNGKYGPFINEYLSNAAAQIVYVTGSAIAKRILAQPSVANI